MIIVNYIWALLLIYCSTCPEEGACRYVATSSTMQARGSSGRNIIRYRARITRAGCAARRDRLARALLPRPSPYLPPPHAPLPHPSLARPPTRGDTYEFSAM
ncbi:unnamed protein product [Danaus chrysippus]|uniref:(African queen) hypothetical protein n=1 Tax=Danaus chrysippus TaxID=151541 RepID=A0A8J2QUX6_9NEOP|nr:unnamed protein product [Danaus chrysippus]